MRIVIVFAPLFLEWGKEIVRTMHREQPDTEIIGLATTRIIYDDLKKADDLEFLQLDCVEEKERAWLAQPADNEKLEKYEAEWGVEFLRKLVIADRHVGAGYITGGLIAHSELWRKTRTDEGVCSFVTGLMDYLAEMFSGNRKPDLVLSYFVAGSLSYALSEVVKRNGGEFYTFINVRIGNRTVLDTSPVSTLDCVRTRFQEVLKKPGLVDEHREEAQAWLDEFRGKLTVMPEYATKAFDKYKEQLRPHNIVKNIVMTSVKAVAYPFVRGRRPLRGEPGWQKVWRSIYCPLTALRYFRRGFYRTSQDVKSRPYIYYALHVEPEASTMVLSPYHTNQLAVIEALSKAAPLSWRIVVKEHLVMVGKRPRGFYEKIAAMPNVDLVHPTENSMHLIHGAKLTATITGTVGWESILLGKPTLILGGLPFSSLEEGFVLCGDLSTLPEAIEKALNTPPADDERLVNYLATLYSESFEIPFAMWGSPSQDVLRENKDATDEVVRCLLHAGKHKKAAA